MCIDGEDGGWEDGRLWRGHPFPVDMNKLWWTPEEGRRRISQLCSGLVRMDGGVGGGER